MAYDKSQVQNAGKALVDVIDAVKDGLDAGDVTAAVGLLTAIAACVDEFKGDTDAAALHLVATVADIIGDQRVNAAP